MAKILLVEDDNNLREIFEMRLQAEGYQTATAGNGEEGLAVAMQEKPDLIVADVMMPKLSGFEMLETLRAAPEMKDTKVIMMTALGQAEDQARGEKLGVLKYLVKSQVTLEDFARVIKEILQPGESPAANSDKIEASNKESEKSMPDDTSNNPAGSDNPMSSPGAAPADDSGQMSTADEQAQVDQKVDDAMNNTPAVPPAPDLGGDSGAGAPAGSDVPVSSPPAGDDSSSTPAEGGEQPPAPAV